MSTSSPRLPPDVPERIGRYEILLPIASGGMATVYLARTVGPGGFTTEVALKLTHAHLRENPDFSHDLLEEAKLVARIRHHNVVPVIDVGEDPRGIYLVMEYVEGDSLAGLFRKAGSSMPRGIAARFVLDALEGLHAAHELRDASGELLGLVHRDFTPHNILVGTDGVARLADFGIAKAATRLGNTRMGMVKGKIAYMSPEQARGMPLDRRCDVWAAGVVAWELLAGRRLYIDEDDISTLLKVATEEPPRLTSVVPGISKAISDAVASALIMDVEKRCPTASAFGKSLGSAMRASLAVAEPSEAAEWMMRLVGTKVSERRMAAAEVEARRSQTAMTPAAARRLASETTGDKTATGSDAEPVVVTHSRPALPPAVPPPAPPPAPTAVLPAPPPIVRQPTQAIPTRLLPPEPEGKPTDAVAIVAGPQARPFPLSPRTLGLVAVTSAAIIVAVTAMRLSRSHDDGPLGASTTATGATPSSTTSAPVPPSAPAPQDSAPAVPAPRPTLRVHANAPLAEVRMDGRSVAVVTGVTDVDIEMPLGDRTTAIAMDAVSTDGRRVAMLIAPTASEMSLEFPPLAAAPAPAKPAPPPPRRPPPPATAPLAPSPYP